MVQKEQGRHQKEVLFASSLLTHAVPCGSREVGVWGAFGCGDLALKYPRSPASKGLGPKLILSAIGEAYGKDGEGLEEMLRDLGSIGGVAESCWEVRDEGEEELGVRDVYERVLEAGGVEGVVGARTMQREMLASLLQQCRSKEEAGVLVSLGVGQARWGLGEAGVLGAMERVLMGEEKAGDGVLRRVFAACPDWERVGNVVVEGVREGGRGGEVEVNVEVVVGLPVRPMVGVAVKSFDDAVERVGKWVEEGGDERSGVLCDWKYDGERLQVHRNEDGELFGYSRRGEDVSWRFEDMIQACGASIPESVGSFILEGEVVPVDDENNNTLLPFQALSKRGRSANKPNIPAHFFAFDLLHLSSTTLLHLPLSKRREKLASILTQHPSSSPLIHLSKAREIGGSGEDVKAIAKEAVRDGCEGIMLKPLHHPYLPGTRTIAWLKLKPNELAEESTPMDDSNGVGDTLDLVPVAAYWGKGSRTGKFGSFLMACVKSRGEGDLGDEDGGLSGDDALDSDPTNPSPSSSFSMTDEVSFVPLCRLGTGMTDAMLSEFTETLQYTTATKENIPTNLRIPLSLRPWPDVWIEPSYVWEVRGAQLSKSPTYTAALDEDGKGTALRFPRFVKGRLDKEPIQATDEDYIRMLKRS